MAIQEKSRNSFKLQEIVVPDYVEQVHRTVLLKLGEQSFRETASDVYEILALREDLILSEKDYHTYDPEKSLSPRSTYCLNQMLDAIKHGDEHAFWVWLLDSIDTYDFDARSLTKAQCQTFMAMYEFGCHVWPAEATEMKKDGIDPMAEKFVTQKMAQWDDAD